MRFIRPLGIVYGGRPLINETIAIAFVASTVTIPSKDPGALKCNMLIGSQVAVVVIFLVNDPDGEFGFIGLVRY
jgi:hypothetical protein